MKFLCVWMCLLLVGCSVQANEEVKSFVIEVEQAAYGEALKQLWEERYPNQPLEYVVANVNDQFRKVLQQEPIRVDFYLIEDTYVASMFEESMDLEVFLEEVEVGVPENYLQVFKRGKQSYLPMTTQGMVFAYNPKYYQASEVQTFENLFKVGYPNAMYIYPDVLQLYPFLQLQGFQFFKNDRISVENFTSKQMLRMLQELKAVLGHFQVFQNSGYYDSWFMHDTYPAGFVSDQMQIREYQDHFNEELIITQIPSYRLYELQPLVYTTGYGVNQNSDPVLVQQMIELLRSYEGIQTYLQYHNHYVVVQEKDLNYFTYQSDLHKQFVYALSNGKMKVQSSYQNTPTFDFLMKEDVQAVLKQLVMNEMTPNQAQIQLVNIVKEYLQ